MNCPICGQPVPFSRHKYCSPTCMKRAGARAHYARVHANRKPKPKPTKPLPADFSQRDFWCQIALRRLNGESLCNSCGKSFVPAYPTEKFCSSICREDFFRYRFNVLTRNQ